MTTLDFNANFSGKEIYVYKNGSQIGSFTYPGSKVFDFQDTDRILLAIEGSDVAGAPNGTYYAQSMPRSQLGETVNGVLIGPPGSGQGEHNRVDKNITNFYDGVNYIGAINDPPYLLILKNNSSQYTIGMFKDNDWYALPVNPGTDKWSIVGGYKGAGMAHSFANHLPKLIDVGGIVQNNAIYDYNGSSYDTKMSDGTTPLTATKHEYDPEQNMHVPVSVSVQSTNNTEKYWEIEYAKAYAVKCNTTSAGAFLKFYY